MSADQKKYIKCPNCGSFIEEGTKFCSQCGAPMAVNSSISADQTQSAPTAASQISPKKKEKKKGGLFIWLGIIAIVILIIGALGSNNDNGNEADLPSDNSQVENNELRAHIETKDEYKESCTVIDYRTIERNPEDYEGTRVKIVGNVIQVSEGFLNSLTLRIQTNYGIWYVDYTKADGESRILENDEIIAYGECTGVTTYRALLGNSVTIPSMDMKYYDNVTYSKPSTSEVITSDDAVPKSDTNSTNDNITSDQLTAGQRNALASARNYLNFSAFSRGGLISQLEFEEYSTEDATFAVDNCGADWNEQAVRKAKSYLDFSAFSYSGLINQLEFEEFTPEEAQYGVDNCGADWNEQAVKKAKSYLDFSSFSKSSLINQLEFEGFTHEQAVYGAEQNGY